MRRGTWHGSMHSLGDNVLLGYKAWYHGGLEVLCVVECGHPFGYVDSQLTMGTILECPIVGYTRRRRGEICPPYSNPNTILEEAGNTCSGELANQGVFYYYYDLSSLFMLNLTRVMLWGFWLGSIAWAKENLRSIFCFCARMMNNAWVVNSGGCIVLLFIYVAPYMRYQTTSSHHLQHTFM